MRRKRTDEEKARRRKTKVYPFRSLLTPEELRLYRNIRIVTGRDDALKAIGRSDLVSQ